MSEQERNDDVTKETEVKDLGETRNGNLEDNELDEVSGGVVIKCGTQKGSSCQSLTFDQAKPRFLAVTM